MPEPDENEDMVSRRVITETVSASSTKGTAITIGIIVAVAIALVVWVILQMR